MDLSQLRMWFPLCALIPILVSAWVPGSPGAHLTWIVSVGRVDCFGMARDIDGNAVLERFMREGSNGEDT